MPEENTAVEVARWSFHDDSVRVFEDANDGLPWKVVWCVGDDVTEEEYVTAAVAFARLAVLAHAVEFDEDVVHHPANVPQDRTRFAFQARRMLTHTVHPR